MTNFLIMKNLLNKIFLVFFVVIAVGVNAMAGDTGTTAGEVPPIVMTPHGSVGELRSKVSREFRITNMDGVLLHEDMTLKKVGLTLKNRTEASKVFRKNRKDFKSDEYYLEKSRKFLQQHANKIGIESISSYLKYAKIEKKKHTGGLRVNIFIYVYGYKLEGAHVRVSFGSDDTIIGLDFDLPQITPEMYRAVKVAKDKIIPLEELTDKIGVEFMEMAKNNGWITEGSKDNYKEVVTIYPPESLDAIKIIDKDPYLVLQFGVVPKYGKETAKYKAEYEGYHWSAIVDPVAGKVVEYFGANYND